jgi:hypothetical protein
VCVGQNKRVWQGLLFPVLHVVAMPKTTSVSTSRRRRTSPLRRRAADLPARRVSVSRPRPTPNRPTPPRNRFRGQWAGNRFR